MPDFNARGLRIAAITVDAPETSRRHGQKLGLKFPVLSDAKTDVIQRYDVLHKGGGPGGSDIARPAEFLIDPTGAIRWVNLTERVTVRTRPQEVLKAFDDLKLSSASQ